MITFPSDKEIAVFLIILTVVPLLTGIGVGWLIWS